MGESLMVDLGLDVEERKSEKFRKNIIRDDK